MCKLIELKKCLEKLEPGEIKKTNKLEEMLANCWNELMGGEGAGMHSYKLHGRIEEVEDKVEATSEQESADIEDISDEEQTEEENFVEEKQEKQAIEE